MPAATLCYIKFPSVHPHLSMEDILPLYREKLKTEAKKSRKEGSGRTHRKTLRANHGAERVILQHLRNPLKFFST